LSLPPAGDVVVVVVVVAGALLSVGVVVADAPPIHISKQFPIILHNQWNKILKKKFQKVDTQYRSLIVFNILSQD
jgi:hypothetical protein